MLVYLVLGLVGAYLFLCALVYLFQDSLIFLPDRTLDTTPDKEGMTCEDVRIAVTPSEAIHAWYFPRMQSLEPAGTVLICHGNAGNISQRLSTAQMFLDLGCSVLLFDYRGYGLSDGRPSEKNTYADARAAWNWLLSEKQVHPQSLFVFGRSLGGAVAVELAGQVKCGGLILESTFTSAANMGQWLYPFLPIKWLSRTRFDSQSRIGKLNCPILVAHSPSDEMVPFSLGRALYEAAGPDKRFVELAGGHNELRSLNNDLYRKVLRDFLHVGPGDSTI